MVETRKRRITKPTDTPALPEVEVKAAPVTEVANPVPAEEPAEVLSKLSKSELDARTRALEESKVRDVEDRKRAEVDQKRRETEDAERTLKREQTEQQKAEQEARETAGA